MKYRMVIFDLDGTLCDTLADLWEACNYALMKCALPKISLEQTKSYVGNGIRNLLLKASNSKGNIDELVERFLYFYDQNYVVHTKVYPHIKEVLKYCKEKNLILGVFTNKGEPIARKIVNTLFANTFDFVYGEVPGRLKKPNETFLLEIIKEYGMNLTEVLYIGDSEVDIKTSNNANIAGAFVSYGFRNKAELLSYTSRVVEKPLDLIYYIGE